MNSCGIDIVEISRLEEARKRPGFDARIFSCRELAEGARKGSPPQYYAGRWAAKEAAAKALGCGFGEKCSPQEVEILSGENGSPGLFLSGRAAQTARDKGIVSWCVSITHEKHYAAAMAVAEIDKEMVK